MTRIKVNYYLNSPNLSDENKEYLNSLLKGSKEYFQFLDEIRCSILLKFSLNGKSIRTTINQSIEPKNWDSKKQRPIKRYENYTHLNAFLNYVENKVTETFNNLDTIPETPLQIVRNIIKPEAVDIEIKKTNNFLELVEIFIEHSISGKRLIKNHTLSESTIRSYMQVYKNFKEYLKHNNSLNLNYNELKLSHINGYVNFLTERKYADNSKVHDLRILKTIVQYLYESELVCDNKILEKIKVGALQNSTMIALNEDEYMKLKNTKFRKNKWEYVRKVFLFQINTGLRKQDLFKLSEKNFDFEKKTITLHQQKTSGHLIIPLSDFLISIAKEVNFKFSRATNYNQLLKIVCKNAGIDEIIEVTRWFNGRATTIKDNKYNLISSHTARRTFVTLAIKKGIPTEMIMRISGHKTRASFEKYIKITQQEAVNEFRNKFDL